MRLGYWISGGVGEVWVCIQPNCYPWVSRGCLLKLGYGTSKPVEETRLGEDALWDPQEILAGVRIGCSWCSVAVLVGRQGNCVWGKREGEQSSVGSLPTSILSFWLPLVYYKCSIYWSFFLFLGNLDLPFSITNCFKTNDEKNMWE